jgi:hypothetical protein
MVAAISKKRRMPEGGTDVTRRDSLLSRFCMVDSNDIYGFQGPEYTAQMGPSTSFFRAESLLVHLRKADYFSFNQPLFPISESHV